MVQGSSFSVSPCSSARRASGPVNQPGVGQAGGFPEFGVHADAGEAGDGVDFVQVDRAGDLIDKEIDPGHAGTINGLVGLYGHLADLFGRRGGQGCRDEQAG